MTARRLFVGVCALAVLAGLYFVLTYFQVSAAGGVAGSYAWASKNCYDEVVSERMELAAENLQSHYRNSWPDAYNAAFIRAHEKLKSAKAAIGRPEACEMFIKPLDYATYRGWVEVGLIRITVSVPERAYVPPNTAALPPSLPPPSSQPEPAVTGTTAERISGSFLKDTQQFLDESGDPKEKGLLVAKFSHGVLRRRATSGIAPFRITASSGSNYFFKLVRLYTNEEELAGFIVGGTPLETKVPTGSYELRYAAGQGWISEAELFGPDTAFAKADSPLNFTVEGNQARGVEVRLILQRGGNLKTSPIKRSEF